MSDSKIYLDNFKNGMIDFAIKSKLLGFNMLNGHISKVNNLYSLPVKNYYINYDGFCLVIQFNDSCISIITIKDNSYQVDIYHYYLVHSIYLNDRNNFVVLCLDICRVSYAVCIYYKFVELDSCFNLVDVKVFNKIYSSILVASDLDFVNFIVHFQNGRFDYLVDDFLNNIDLDVKRIW